MLTFFQSKTGSIEGSEEDKALIKNFPYDNYDIYQVPFLGSFFLDRDPDYIKDRLKKGAVWEPYTKALIEKHVAPDSIVIDIGAHIGTHTLTLSQCAKQVYAFEPQKKMFAELVMNLKLNRCNNVIAYRCAIGNSSTTIQMNKVRLGNEGSTEIGLGGDSAPMISLDDLHLNNVSLIKIDVENTESEVLLGAYNTILRNRPVILIEIRGNTYNISENRDSDIVKTIDWLIQVGYVINSFTAGDYIAIPIQSLCEKLGWNESACN